MRNTNLNLSHLPYTRMVWITYQSTDSGELCCCSVTRLCPTLPDPRHCSTPGFPVLHHLPNLAQTHVHWVSDAIQPSHTLVVPFSSCHQSFPASGSFLMSRLSSHLVTKVLEFQLQHHSFQSIFKTDLINWFDLAIQGTLKSLIQHHSSKASILWHPPFFMVQFSHSWLLEKS